MSDRNFMALLEARWAAGYHVCVGLDPDPDKIPKCVLSGGSDQQILASFLNPIVRATKDYVASYKPNAAFYERLGEQGTLALRSIIRYIREVAPDVPVILDGKRADIGNSNTGYVEAAFDYQKADAVTVNPYFGGESLEPFFGQTEKGIFVMCHTSNPGAAEIQDRLIIIDDSNEMAYLREVGLGNELSGTCPDCSGLYRATSVSNHIAYLASQRWNTNGNIDLVVGATYPDQLSQIRRIVGKQMPILIPGVGKQGGDLAAAVRAGGSNILLNASRDILNASNGEDFAEAAGNKARELHEAIKRILDQNLDDTTKG